MAKGRIHSFETFGAADGPGVRFMVFLSGCPLRCAYCHNPDTWAGRASTPLSPLEMEAADVLAKALRYRSYWGTDGGITVSGGEPLLQLDFLIDLFTRAKAQGVSTCIDTSGAPFTREGEWFGKFNELLKVTDLLLLDIKAFDSSLHKALTGADNANILDLARYLSEIGKPVWIRHVLVPGLAERLGSFRVELESSSVESATDQTLSVPNQTLNDTNQTLNDTKKIAAFVKTLSNVKRIDILPYHVFGVAKWQALGLPYRLTGAEPPTTEELSLVRSLFA